MRGNHEEEKIRLLVRPPDIACKACATRSEHLYGHMIVRTGEHSKREFFLCVGRCERAGRDAAFLNERVENAHAPEVTLVDPAGTTNVVSISGVTCRLHR